MHMTEMNDRAASADDVKDAAGPTAADDAKGAADGITDKASDALGGAKDKAPTRLATPVTRPASCGRR